MIIWLHHGVISHFVWVPFKFFTYLLNMLTLQHVITWERLVVQCSDLEVSVLEGSFRTFWYVTRHIYYYYLAKCQVCYSFRLFLCKYVCIFLCLFALYRPHYSTNLFQIFFLTRYPWPAELGRISSKSDDGIRSKKIPENPKNPYLS